jgi:hypothetical protein
LAVLGDEKLEVPVVPVAEDAADDRLLASLPTVWRARS